MRNKSKQIELSNLEKIIGFVAILGLFFLLVRCALWYRFQNKYFEIIKQNNNISLVKTVGQEDHDLYEGRLNNATVSVYVPHFLTFDGKIVYNDNSSFYINDDKTFCYNVNITVEINDDNVDYTVCVIQEKEEQNSKWYYYTVNKDVELLYSSNDDDESETALFYSCYEQIKQRMDIVIEEFNL